MTDPDGELSDGERERMAALPRQASPPVALEEATVDALVARGLIRRARPVRGPRPWHVVLATAAGILLFVGGLTMGRRSSPSAGADQRSEFMLLLYEGPEYRHPAAGQEQERVQEYSAWARHQVGKGDLVAAEKLKNDWDMMIRGDGTVATPPPANEAERLAGFFIIRANDRGAALEVARGCPHLRYGGSILIREIERT